MRMQLSSMLVTIGLSISSLVFAEIRPFADHTLQNLQNNNMGRPWLLIVWSIHCPPCYSEMELLAKLQRRKPGLNVEFISMDGEADEEEIRRALDSHQLDSWFSFSSDTDRLRYIIDPDWRGELPRNYFYQADGIRCGYSGSLKEQHVLAWFGPENRNCQGLTKREN